MGTKKFVEQYFIFPASNFANEIISKHPSLEQVEPERKAICFVGRNKIILPVFPVSEMIFKTFKKSELSFYAFVQKTKDGAKQYFFSKNLERKKSNKLAEEIDKLLKKTEK